MILNNLNSIIFLLVTISYEVKSGSNDTCPFTQTVDLTDAILLPNASYLYENDTIIAPQFVQDFNYTLILDNGNTKRYRTHKRGCICAVKQCLPICSDKIKIFYKNYKSSCVDWGFSKNVSFKDGTVKRKHVLRDFHPVYGNVCAAGKGYMMSPELETYSGWTLYENSILLRHHDKRNLSITEYCFDLEILNKDYQFLINPVVCGETIEIPWFKIWAMAFSIPFLIITIICYYNLTPAHMSRSKCFITYLSFVTISYTLICFYTITGIDLENIPCQIFGFLVYYTIIGYLTWTCILSYDTWKSLTDINDNEVSFGTYSLIGWLLPILLTFLTFVAQVSNMPDIWKPGIEDMCAVNTLRWSAVIYYYIPCILAFIYSLTLYVWIVVFKRKHNEELLNLFGKGPEPAIERCVLFFRIFLFMGISWSLDIVSYFSRMAFGSEECFIYLILDLFNAFHGFFVFLAFICRPSVIRKIKEIFANKFLS